ncbi:hypothetical protein [Acetobacter senegalensis]
MASPLIRGSVGRVVGLGRVNSYITPTRIRERTHTDGQYIDNNPTQPYNPTQRGDLNDLANAVQRLTIDRRDPEKFHQDKSEIVSALRRMARKARS